MEIISSLVSTPLNILVIKAFYKHCYLNVVSPTVENVFTLQTTVMKITWQESVFVLDSKPQQLRQDCVTYISTESQIHSRTTGSIGDSYFAAVSLKRNEKYLESVYWNTQSAWMGKEVKSTKVRHLHPIDTYKTS